MKVLISSVIDGFKEYRDAAAKAISELGYETIRAEDFPATPLSPQAACLAGVRDANAVVVIVGSRYGFRQQSGLSATHEEYREARESRPVLAFIEEGVERDADQAAFVREIQNWENGPYTAPFSDVDQLREAVIRGLHAFAVAAAATPVSEQELETRARELLPSSQQFSSPTLFVAIASGPTRAVLRPAELEGDDLSNFLLTESLTGPCALFRISDGTDHAVVGDTIELSQRQPRRLVRLDESARITIALPAVADRDSFSLSIPSIIEEDVQSALGLALRFSARVLDHVDSPIRLTHFVAAVALLGGGYLPWRTGAEQAMSPNRANLGTLGDRKPVVTLTPSMRRRQQLAQESEILAEDLVVRLRRAFRQ